LLQNLTDEERTLDCETLLRAILDVEEESSRPTRSYGSPHSSPHRTPHHDPPHPPRQAWVVAPSGSTGEVSIPHQEPQGATGTPVEEIRGLFSFVLTCLVHVLRSFLT